MSKDSPAGFECDKCHKWVVINEFIGTKNRNHCPFCLSSKHVDDKEAGDRQATCQSVMRPIGLTFKAAGLDKYGRHKMGELMIIHLCERGDKVSINSIAADDDTDLILSLMNTEAISVDDRQKITETDIKILDYNDEASVKTALFGKT